MNKHMTVLAATSGMVIILALVLSLPATAQVTGSSPNSTAPVQQGAIDPTDLETFLDEFFDQNMDEMNIPGAAIVVVQDGAIILSKGYGFADLEQQIPVDPAKTIMRFASTSKLFTATAAMQLVEEGLIDLDADVNQYLTGVQLPDDPSGPVPLRQLLTQRPASRIASSGLSHSIRMHICRWRNTWRVPCQSGFWSRVTYTIIPTTVLPWLVSSLKM